MIFHNVSNFQHPRKDQKLQHYPVWFVQYTWSSEFLAPASPHSNKYHIIIFISPLKLSCCQTLLTGKRLSRQEINIYFYDTKEYLISIIIENWKFSVTEQPHNIQLINLFANYKNDEESRTGRLGSITDLIPNGLICPVDSTCSQKQIMRHRIHV